MCERCLRGGFHQAHTANVCLGGGAFVVGRVWSCRHPVNSPQTVTTMPSAVRCASAMWEEALGVQVLLVVMMRACSKHRERGVSDCVGVRLTVLECG